MASFKGGKESDKGDLVSPLVFVLMMEYLTRTVQYAAAHTPEISPIM